MMKQIFLTNFKHDARLKTINVSTAKYFFKCYPKYKQLCENILIKYPQYEHINHVLRCIVFDIQLPKCKTCGNDLFYSQMITKKIYCCKKCVQNDHEIKTKNKEKRKQTCLLKYRS